jgi:hypothetical protein
MEIVRQLEEPLRSAFRAANRAPAWLGLLGILAVSGLLLGLGFAAGLLYCEYRRVTEFQQLAGVTKELLPVTAQCMATLREIAPAAIIFARNARPQMVPMVVRDSARERRWTSP